MATTKSSKGKKRGWDLDDLRSMFDTEPKDYKLAWDKFKQITIGLNEHARETIPLVCLLQ